MSVVDDRQFLDGELYDVEEAFSDDTGTFDRRKVKVGCPGCGREFAALCSPKTRLVRSGWRWHTMECRDPTSDYVTNCRCGREFRFTTYVPQ